MGIYVFLLSLSDASFQNDNEPKELNTTQIGHR